nr:Chain C, PHE-GLU-PHE-PRO-PRO-PRO-PRO-THR-ASP-GLU-GLU [synthetic construct]1QC6_D Chain D, PHE-GLU-PHE-PRO-PRO-PRO-PRO-THR-ASP-GLU-GLU [synthetic construct]
FEFPPPPTDEE